jgi:anti-sigma factor RsiW
MGCTISPERLGAYRDKELDEAETEQLRAHIDTCVECRTRLTELTHLSAMLNDSLEQYSAPDTLRARVRSALAAGPPRAESRPWRRPEWSRIAAAVIVSALLSGGGTYAAVRHNFAARATTDAVMAAHLRSLMPGHLTDVASTEHHNVKPWFNGRIDLSPSVPNLDAAGFALVGGRLDFISGRPVAAVVYARRRHMINVVSWPDASGKSAPVTASTERGFHVLRWSSGGMETWVVSDLNRAELEQFAAAFTAAR